MRIERSLFITAKLFLLILIIFRASPGFTQNTNNLSDSALTLPEPHKQIVILNSWGSGLPIPDDAKQGIRLALEADGFSMNDVFFEDLDLLRSLSKEHRLNLVSLLSHKFQHKQIGIVMLIGPPAVELIANEGKDLFPDASIVALITPDVNALKNDPRKIMHLQWHIDPGGSVEVALELFPDTKHVFVITGAKDGVLPFLDVAKEAFIPWGNTVDFEYSNDMTYEEMIARVSSLTKESIILYSTFFSDKLNHSFIPAEVAVEVCKKSEVPVFAMFDHYLGLGILGGALLETEMMGKQAGSIALDYLNGKILIEEHVKSFDTPIYSMVDWQIIKHFQVNKKEIPEDFIVAGKPPALWDHYKILIVTVICIILILSILIITILIWNYRIQKIKTSAIESEETLKVILDDLPLPIAHLRTDGIVLYRNKRFLETIGYTTNEVKTIEELWQFAYPDEQYRNSVIQNWNESVNRAIETGSDITSGEYQVTCKDGRLRIIIISGVMLSDGLLVAFNDLTERKKAERELILAKENAEESDKLKSAFLANMSHEIRTPMNGILGFSELLKKPNLSNEKQQVYIQIIKSSSTRMLSIINDIIDISKIEAGLMNLNIKESNINEQIEEVYNFFKPEVEAKGIELYFKKALPIEESTIYTDHEKLYAILLNLVKNAIKFTEKGSIEFGYNVVTGSEPVDLEFFVKDTGIGIPKDRQEAIFERFIQADISDKMAKQGAGLGLSISKAYVEMLGGKIRGESEAGVGSCFYFTLPYNVKKEEKGSTEEVYSSDKKDNDTSPEILGLKIMIAEDDEVSEMLISIFIKEVCKEVVHVRTGTEAVEACRNDPSIDLVLMDILMPEMGGLEATRQIRKFNKDLIVIAQTAFSLTGDRDRAIEAGCNDYIAKPIDKEKLLALIQKYSN